MLYTPDERDTVFEETEFPSPLAGAPLPTIFATEHRLLLAYHTKLWQPEPPSNKRSNMPVLVNESSLGTVTVVDFRRPAAFSHSLSVALEAMEYSVWRWKTSEKKTVLRIG